MIAVDALRAGVSCFAGCLKRYGLVQIAIDGVCITFFRRVPVNLVVNRDIVG